MKKLKSIKWSFLLASIFLISACDNELLTGQFSQETCFDSAIPGNMRASIDDLIDFDQEIQESADDNYSRSGGFMIVHANGFTHLYIGAFDDNFGVLSMDIINPEIGVFDLATTNETGFVDNANNHEMLESFGYYSTIGVESGEELPYVSFADQGGSGQVEITELDLVNQFASGKFSFFGNRKQINPDNGEPILDGNGDPIIETIEIACGNFNNIPYTFLLETSSGSPRFNDFYAEVDGDEFLETSVSVETVTGNGTRILYIKALTNSGRLLRIDVPQELGEGTFAFEPISDGSVLTALYNNSNGAESLTANPGTITITNFDDVNGVIEATFSFTGTDPFGIDPTVVEVTNGEFKLSFNSTGGPPDELSAMVDNVVFETSTLTVVKSDFLGRDIVNISALTAENESLEIIFPEDIDVGPYIMRPNVTNGNQKVGLYSPDDGVVTSNRSDPGTLTIISYDTTTGEIVGSFEFEAIDIFGQNTEVYSVTNGTFSVVIPQ